MKAARIHQLFFNHLVLKLNEAGQKRVIALSPNSAINLFRDEVDQICERHNWEFIGQTEGDLGERMNTYFVEQFRCGAEKAVLIGSDCPFVNVNTIELAFEQLESHDFVIGPAEDGGYFLVAMRQPHSFLFENIQWSSDSVMTTTRRRIENAGRSCYELDSSFDIDTKNDLERFLNANKLEESDDGSLEGLRNRLRELVESPDASELQERLSNEKLKR